MCLPVGSCSRRRGIEELGINLGRFWLIWSLFVSEVGGLLGVI